MDIEQRWLARLDVTLSYLVSEGAGRTIVLLHGLAGSSTELIPMARALSECRVLLLDQRGHGRSARRPDDTSRAAFVADVVALIEADASHPVTLIG
jgi:pimeloyl-ACP methyl ester carboxylesterase